MYHYITDKELKHRMKEQGSGLMEALCRTLRHTYGVRADFHLVGSGAHNLITQNENGSVELAYYLEIHAAQDLEDGAALLRQTRAAFNEVLEAAGCPDCIDGPTVLRTQARPAGPEDKTPFFVDVCLVRRGGHHDFCRLIHERDAYTGEDRCYWNPARKSTHLHKKAARIKHSGEWEQVRSAYLEQRNRSLAGGEAAHPAFLCYLEAVDHVYHLLPRQA